MRNRTRLFSKVYCVYIITNFLNTVLYVGFTSCLKHRIWQHKTGFYPDSFTSRYHVNQLVYYEVYDNPFDGICREKQLKAGSRKKKIDLIISMNPGWRDLYDELEYD